MDAIEEFEKDVASELLLQLIRDIASFSNWYLKLENPILNDNGNERLMTVDVMNGMLHDMVNLHINKKNI